MKGKNMYLKPYAEKVVFLEEDMVMQVVTGSIPMPAKKSTVIYDDTSQENASLWEDVYTDEKSW